jgi:sugar O-acyltransferase (sialic acid O-acetyltransferase NeuD family)
MVKKIILIGAGTHSHSCVELIEKEKKFSIYGFIDPKKSNSNLIKKFRYLGSDNKMKDLRKKVSYAIVSIGFIKDYLPRKKNFDKIKKLKFKIPKIVSPISYISKNAKIGNGTMIFHHVIVNSNVIVGENCIINNKVLLEHDVKIGNNVHISTGCIVNGSSSIGSNTFVGSRTVISNNIKIGKNCFIKIGSIVKKDMPDNTKF